MKALVVVVALAGCSFQPGSLQGAVADAGGSGDGGSSGDAGIDAASGMCMNWAPQANPAHVSPCAVPPGPAYTLSIAAVYDTTTGTFVSAAPAPPSAVVGNLRVISVDEFTLNADLRVVGTMPLVIVSWSTITLNAKLDVSSERTGSLQVLGPGARDTNAANGGGSQDCGGGGGGGFGTVGGNGGNGGNSGGNGGAIAAVPITVVGGRAGALGGSSGTTRGGGGGGGGAIQLTARQEIVVNSAGRIHAGGAGGEGGKPNDGGGGGGGSGGYIGLDAPTVKLFSAAILAANGGGGGTGCDAGDGPEGANGQLGSSTAAGGAASTCSVARAGGSGGAGTTVAGFGADSPESGGGGGGGVGFILVWTGSLTNMAVVSPALMQR